MSGFNDVIHPANRLSLMAMLANRDWVDFAFLRESLGVSDSTVSKQLAVLEDAGYLELKKLGKGPTRKTRVQITSAGQAAFDAHVGALQAMLSQPQVPIS